MARIKKDGTPAKKPGRKPAIKLDGELKIETPEAKKVEIVETPEGVVKGPVAVDEFCKIFGYPDEEPEKPKQPLTYEGFKVCCIENNYGRFYWDCDHNHLDWTTGEGEEVSFTPQGWVTFCRYVMPKVMEILGV